MTVTKMQHRWFDLWKRVGAHGNALPIYKDLVRRYSEPHRRYHTLAHIEHCLRELETARHLAQNVETVEWSLWFHDAIYDIASKTNEEDSMLLSMQAAEAAKLPLIQFSSATGALIMATKHHAPSTTVDMQLMLDIDLAILGQPHDVFDKFERNIRAEYQPVPDEIFYLHRGAILNELLRRPSFYQTSFFRTKYNAMARRNIGRALMRYPVSPSS